MGANEPREEAVDDGGESELSPQELNGALVLSSLRAQDETDAAVAQMLTLREAAELRERLLGILGHDLRAPLGAVIMGTGMLLSRGNLSSDDARLADRANKSARRMSRMILQLLDFTRARLGGDFPLDVRVGTDLGSICKSVCEELALATSIRVVCIADGDVSGTWDADRLAEIISNVAGNAVEHARPGSCVEVRVVDEGPDVVVTIANEGSAIPREVLAHLFDPFRRAKHSQRSTAGNLGLGLYIAHEITRAHCGTLVARSETERTTFTMRLPRRRPPASSER